MRIPIKVILEDVDDNEFASIQQQTNISESGFFVVDQVGHLKMVISVDLEDYVFFDQPIHRPPSHKRLFLVGQP